MNLSFAGCGFLGIYHVGVAVCFKNYAPQVLLERISGASAGALAACCLLCDLPLASMTTDFLHVVREARRYSLGPFSPSFNIQRCLLEGLQQHLPLDAHERVTGRLCISLTRCCDGQNVRISQFASRQELLQALLCSCFIPGLSGLVPPRLRGVRYMDGAFSDNLPIWDEQTVTVSPFCGKSDICPRDQSWHKLHLNLNWANTSIRISRRNMQRLLRIVFPARAEFLSSICQQGYEDALRYLQSHQMIKGRRQAQDLKGLKRVIHSYMDDSQLSAVKPLNLLGQVTQQVSHLMDELMIQLNNLALCDQPHFDLLDAMGLCTRDPALSASTSRRQVVDNGGDKVILNKRRDDNAAKVKVIEILDSIDMATAAAPTTVTKPKMSRGTAAPGGAIRGVCIQKASH